MSRCPCLMTLVVVVGCFNAPAAAADVDLRAPARDCSSLALDSGGQVVFGANLDHVTVDEGLVFVNKRHFDKTGLNPSTTGEYARWRSRYASLTFNLVGYQFAWAGMNEQGLTLSTMSLYDTEYPAPDERPPLDSGEWMQYLLDTCATIDDVVATDDRVRIITVDHYLVADGLGNVAIIEFLDGDMVVHRGDDLRVAALTNSTYAWSRANWMAFRVGGDYTSLDGSLQRFCLAADRVSDFEVGGDEAAVPYAFDTLEAIRGEQFSIHTSQWSLVFDIGALRAHFRTHTHPERRHVDLLDFDLGCSAPVQMLDIQEPLDGDVAGHFFDYDHDLNLEHLRAFMIAWGISVSDQTLRQMVRHFESFPCLEGQPRRPSGRLSPGQF